MAATPPRPSSPDPLSVIPKPGHTLQISPNLEALLEHDELTRRSTSSAAYNYTSPEFPISLPPPPPRKNQVARKGSQQEPPLATTRGQRSKALGSDLWLDALPQDPSSPSSPSVTPNPYLNPAPVLKPVITQPLIDTDWAQLTPKQADRTFQNESRYTRTSPCLDPSSRPSTALNKVEKILWMGRDSLSLFSGSGSMSKRHDSDRRNDRTECGPGDLDAVQDPQIQQASLQNISRPPSSSGDPDGFSSRLGDALLQRSNVEPSETASSIYSESGPTSDPASTRPRRAAHSLPRLSLPPPSMSHDSPRPPSVATVSGDDYLSFIDFFSPSTPGEFNFCNIQDKSSSSRRQPHSISIPPSSLYSGSTLSLSSTSLASMKFAPPSPTSLAVQHPSPSDSSDSVALSSMVFAPPSPSSACVPPTSLQPFSGPPSPYSPLEFAPPDSPQDVTHKFLPPDSAFERGRMPKSGKRSISLSPHPLRTLLSPLPPTTNHLDPNQRADRIRRNRKLARVFGMVPGTDEPVTDVDGRCVPKKSRSLLMKHKHHRHAVSVSVSLKSPVTKTEPSTPWQTDSLWSPDGRRHSIPLTTGSFTLYVDDGQDGKVAKDPRPGRNITDSPETASTRSFIDLSDEDAREDDDMSTLSFLAPYPLRQQRLHQSSSTPSLVESLDSEAQAEADRRRKREKVAKLHRFLGSRVPPEAIIGNVYGPPLPPATIPEECDRDRRLRGHKSAPSDDFDRGKEELDEKEKALNVRRAQKMERVFGTPPPQTLFHTRPSRPTISQPASPTNPYVLTFDIPSSSRNPNQSAYVRKALHRRGPSDSSRSLLPRIDDACQPSPSSLTQSFAASIAESLSGYQQVLAESSVYFNYQHSLNSLVDIIDRDDRRSLVELHCLLHGGADESPSEEDVSAHSRRVSIAHSLKSERRHSLPSKSSMTSLSSELYVTPKESLFQIRRRKAAKLTNFFGVDYRELIQDILESIEKGVEEECQQGTLQPQEVEVLMHRVRSIRTLRDPFS